MAFNFPNNPTQDQIINGPDGQRLQWDGIRWIALFGGDGSGGGGNYLPVNNPTFTGVLQGPEIFATVPDNADYSAHDALFYSWIDLDKSYYGQWLSIYDSVGDFVVIDNIGNISTSGTMFAYGDLNVGGSVYANGNVSVAVGVNSGYVKTGAGTTLPTLSGPYSAGALYYDTAAGQGLKVWNGTSWTLLSGGGDGGGDGIPEPTTAGNFLRTDAGTWVKGLPISAGQTNALTGPLQLANTGSGAIAPCVLYFGNNTTTPGSQISGNTNGTQLNIAAASNVSATGSSWTARDTSASIIQFQYGTIQIYANSSLITGSIFVPTPRVVIGPSVVTFNVPISLTSMGTNPSTGLVNGLMYYNTGTHTINVYVNGSWRTVNVT